jgi:hypothetical protein
MIITEYYNFYIETFELDVICRLDKSCDCRFHFSASDWFLPFESNMRLSCGTMQISGPALHVTATFVVSFRAHRIIRRQSNKRRITFVDQGKRSPAIWVRPGVSPILVVLYASLLPRASVSLLCPNNERTLIVDQAASALTALRPPNLPHNRSLDSDITPIGQKSHTAMHVSHTVKT